MSSDNSRPKSLREIQGFINIIENRIRESKSRTSVLEETLEKVQSFSFTEGDIIISREQGNSIVCGIGVGQNSEAIHIDDELSDKFYVLIATKEGYIKVPPEDVMPYTTATKILYERS